MGTPRISAIIQYYCIFNAHSSNEHTNHIISLSLFLLTFLGVLRRTCGETDLPRRPPPAVSTAVWTHLQVRIYINKWSIILSICI
jgi:hypothetical protein